jgi:hypothetical protein
VALVKEIGMDKTQYEIALAKQKWISICLSWGGRKVFQITYDFVLVKPYL